MKTIASLALLFVMAVAPIVVLWIIDDPEQGRVIMNVYIDGSAKKSGDGLTPETPVRTVAEAMRVLEKHNRHQQKILNFAPGLYDDL